MTILSSSQFDESACAQEPIHLPGSIQPHGALFVVDPATLQIAQAAIGPGLDLPSPLSRSLKDLLPPVGGLLRDERLHAPDSGPAQLGTIEIRDFRYQVIAHRSGENLIVELERLRGSDADSFDALYPRLRQFLDAIQHASSIDAAMAAAAHEIRQLTGLDRALVYRFDEQWNGAVVSEDRNDALPSYMDLRFPASDIPAQARDLYRLNRLRLIPDANYTPVGIQPSRHPVTGTPPDLSFAVLRSVSPVHLEYMRNMGTAASFSISLIVNDRLWGLISCHNKSPAYVGYAVRSACDFIGQILSMQIAAHESTTLAHERNALRAVQTRLLAQMSGAEHFIEGLVKDETDLLSLTNAAGAAIVSEGNCTLVGLTPPRQHVQAIVEWLAESENEDVTSTDSLPLIWPDAREFKNEATGLLAISISQIHRSYVLWFRPELIRTVTWGGDPHKPSPGDRQARLNPRTSFDNWQEIVRFRSQPWKQAEVEAAGELRAAIVDIVLRKAEELAALSERLQSINKELEAFSYSVSHDLRAPFRHIVGYSQLLKKAEGDKLSPKGNRFIDTIIESAISAGTLVDNLLSFSQMGRATLRPAIVDMNALVAETKKQLTFGMEDRNIEWHVDPLDTVRADPAMMRLVFQNLLENAVKFTKGRDPARIWITSNRTTDETEFHVRDNGAGFEMAYVNKLFGVFQRLHRSEEFEGTGIGLANVKRILERHGGRVWAVGEVDRGATLSFAIPTVERERDGGA